MLADPWPVAIGLLYAQATPPAAWPDECRRIVLLLADAPPAPRPPRPPPRPPKPPRIRLEPRGRAPGYLRRLDISEELILFAVATGAAIGPTTLVVALGNCCSRTTACRRLDELTHAGKLERVDRGWRVVSPRPET